MIKFLKALFFPSGEERFIEGQEEIIVNKKEGTLIINTERDLSEDEIKDIMKRYL